jgi:hypothetical protein
MSLILCSCRLFAGQQCNAQRKVGTNRSQLAICRFMAEIGSKTVDAFHWLTNCYRNQAQPSSRNGLGVHLKATFARELAKKSLAERGFFPDRLPAGV